MIQALGIASGLNIDAEYLRIIQELRALGLYPSGNKITDAQKLAKAKIELTYKIKTKKEEKNLEQELKKQVSNENNENSKMSELEEQRLGAMTVAMLNKIYFGL